MHWSEIPGSAVMDPELLKARRFMQGKIFHFLVQKQSERQITEISQQRIIDLVKRLEEGLFRTAVSQEEYLNLDTLESRLHVFIKTPSSQSTSAPVGNMMPGYSPGTSQHETGSSAGMHGVSTRTSDGIGNQISSAMQSTGNQMGGGTGMRSYPSQDGSGNGGFGSYIKPLNGSGSSEN